MILIIIIHNQEKVEVSLTQILGVCMYLQSTNMHMTHDQKVPAGTAGGRVLHGRGRKPGRQPPLGLEPRPENRDVVMIPATSPPSEAGFHTCTLAVLWC